MTSSEPKGCNQLCFHQLLKHHSYRTALPGAAGRKHQGKCWLFIFSPSPTSKEAGGHKKLWGHRQDSWSQWDNGMFCTIATSSAWEWGGKLAGDCYSGTGWETEVCITCFLSSSIIVIYIIYICNVYYIILISIIIIICPIELYLNPQIFIFFPPSSLPPPIGKEQVRESSCVGLTCQLPDRLNHNSSPEQCSYPKEG